MTGTKLTALTDISTSVSGDDLLYIVDAPGGTPAHKKISLTTLFGTLKVGIGFGTDSTYDIGSSTVRPAVVYSDTIDSPTVRGGSSSGGDIRIDSTSHATPGKVYVGGGSADYYDEANAVWRITATAVGSVNFRAWNASYRPIQLGGQAFLLARGDEAASSFLYAGYNVYYAADGNWKLCINDEAAMVLLGESEGVNFYTWPAAAADSTVAFDDANLVLRIDGDTDSTMGGLAGSFSLMNEAASATNPTLIPHRTDKTSGFGGVGNATPASSYLSAIIGGIEVVRFVGGTGDGGGISTTSRVNVKQYGAMGDGTTNDRVAIQAAMDASYGTLYFPRGIYRVIGKGGSETECLKLTRKLNIVAEDPDRTYIRGDSLGTNESLFKVDIDTNGSLTDVRNWRWEGLGLYSNASGKHTLWIADGFPIYTSAIVNSNIYSYSTNGGYAICVEGSLLGHSVISRCTIGGGIYLNCGDGNTVEKCLFYGSEVAITLDLGLGIYNTVIRENTITNTSGSIVVTDGSAIRIIDNTFEIASGINGSTPSAMVYLHGATYQGVNNIVADNNFGGGTGCDYLIYIDNQYKTVIRGNQMTSCGLSPGFDGHELAFTANADYCLVTQDQVINTSVSNPRTRTMFKAEVSDSGIGTAGVLKLATDNLSLDNGWTGGDFWKNESGIIQFFRPFNSGTTAGGTLIGTLPEGFRPPCNMSLPAACGAGAGSVNISEDGQITVGSLGSNVNVMVAPFTCETNESGSTPSHTVSHTPSHTASHTISHSPS